MAEVPESNQGNSRQRRKSTRIDMTAMVDVAFLLLTFFILTTTPASPGAMALTIPATPDPTKPDFEVASSKILTLILAPGDKIYWYRGIVDPVVEQTDYSASGIRQVLLDHHSARPDLCPPHSTAEEIAAAGCWDPIILFKPMRMCSYRNTIDVLDEFQITNTRKFVLAPFTPEDSILLASKGLN